MIGKRKLRKAPNFEFLMNNDDTYHFALLNYHKFHKKLGDMSLYGARVFKLPNFRIGILLIPDLLAHILKSNAAIGKYMSARKRSFFLKKHTLTLIFREKIRRKLPFLK